MEWLKVPLQLFYVFFWLMLGWHLKIQYELEMVSLSFSSLVSIKLVWDAHHLSLIVFSLWWFQQLLQPRSAVFTLEFYPCKKTSPGLWGSCYDSVSSLKPVCCSGWSSISCSNCFSCSFSLRFQFYTVIMLSHFTRVQLCATPEMAAHQASPSLGFSRQEHWSGLPFPSPMHESEKWKWSHSVVSDPQ